MIESGLLVFFLIPGFAAYCALYGVFHSGKAIAPEPPGANSIEAVTVILLASALVHGLTAVAFDANAWACDGGGCPFAAPASVRDPYAAAFGAMKQESVSSHRLGGLVVLVLGQGLLAWFGIRFWLRRRAARDQLPNWIYGWATGIANSVDNESTLVIAYVLTTHEHDGRAVIYGGLLFDMALKPDGCISRLSLLDCERYLGDFSTGLDRPTLPRPMSHISFLTIEAAHIRNIAFETVEAPPPSV